MDFIVFFKYSYEAKEREKYFANLSDLKDWVGEPDARFDYINACTADEHEEIVFSSVNEIVEAK